MGNIRLSASYSFPCIISTDVNAKTGVLEPSDKQEDADDRNVSVIGGCPNGRLNTREVVSFPTHHTERETPGPFIASVDQPSAESHRNTGLGSKHRSDPVRFEFRDLVMLIG
jgi:hypothetical protein